MFLFRAFDMYVVKVLGGHHKVAIKSLNIILCSASNNNLRVTHATSMSA
jgi:hypothetical protein